MSFGRWVINHLIPHGKDILYDEYMEGWHDGQATGEVIIWNPKKKPVMRGKRMKPTDRLGRTQDEVFKLYNWTRVSS